MTEPCQCPLAPGGNCPRYPSKIMAGNTYRLCQTREDYRALWDAQANGEPPPKRPKVELPVIPPELTYALWPGDRDVILRRRRPLRCQKLGAKIRDGQGRVKKRSYAMI